MQYCGAEREATLRGAYLNAKYQVQNFRKFVCELEQHSQVRKLCMVTHVRSESQLDQLERLKEERTITSSAQACTRGSSCWAARMLWCAIANWTCTPRCEEECAEHDSAEFCTLRCMAISMLLTELRTRWCLRPLRHQCEAKKDV